MSDNTPTFFKTKQGQLIIGAIVIVIAFAALITFYLHQAQTSVLFADLEEAEAARITEQLKEMGITYELSKGGRTISVSKDAVQETRLALLSTDLELNGPTGFELFDQAEFGLTDFAQKVNYRRALEGELARTINSLANVSSSRVHISLPEKKSFLAQKEPPKASVTLSNRQGFDVSVKQVAGIQSLVASAVEGLEPTQVQVLDSQGNALIRGEGSSDLAAQDQLSTKRKVEDYLVEKVQTLLSPSFGADSVTVVADVKLNFDKQKVVVKDIIGADESSGYLLRKSESTQIGASEKGKPGASDKNIEQEFSYGSEVIEKELAAGSIEQLSLAIAIRADIDEAVLKKVELLVAASTGLKPERGDQIQVHSLPAIPVSSVASYAQPIAQIQDPPTETMSKVDASQKTTFSDFVKNINPYHIAVDIGVIVFAIGVLLFIARRKRNQSTPKLKDIEKEQLLLELNTWIKAEPEGVASKGVPS